MEINLSRKIKMANNIKTIYTTVVSIENLLTVINAISSTNFMLIG